MLVEYLPRLAPDGGDPVGWIVAHGRRLGFIRPSARTHIDAPHLPRDQIIPLSAGVVCQRPPRYARRRCAPTNPAVYPDD